jgi:hypothetical protein
MVVIGLTGTSRQRKEMEICLWAAQCEQHYEWSNMSRNLQTSGNSNQNFSVARSQLATIEELLKSQHITTEL